MTGDEMRSEATNRQIAKTSHKLGLLREVQAELTQAVLRFSSTKVDVRASIEKRFDELIETEYRIQQEISDLTYAINIFMKLSAGNGNSPRE